jgi:hypothetical protein
MPIIPISGSAVARGALIPFGTTTYTAANQSLGVGFNLPSSTIYRDLMLVCTLRNDTPGAGLAFYFNGDVGSANYSNSYAFTNGATLSANISTNQNYITWFQEPTSFQAPGNFSTHTFHIMNPQASATSPSRTIIHKWANDQNGAGSTGFQVINWRGVATMNAVTVGSTSGNFSIGSSFSLYGVRSIGQ